MMIIQHWIRLNIWKNYGIRLTWRQSNMIEVQIIKSAIYMLINEIWRVWSFIGIRRMWLLLSFEIRIERGWKVLIYRNREREKRKKEKISLMLSLIICPRDRWATKIKYWPEYKVGQRLEVFRFNYNHKKKKKKNLQSSLC